MSVVTHFNAAAQSGADEASAASTAFQATLARLSPGSLPNDVATSTALPAPASSGRDAENASTSVTNSLSLLYLQNGVMKVLNGVLDRISAARALALDPTKAPHDVASYNAALHALQKQIGSISEGKYNGHEIFGTGDLMVDESLKLERLSKISSDVSRAEKEENAEDEAALRTSFVRAATILGACQEDLERAADRIVDDEIAEESAQSWIHHILASMDVGLHLQENQNSHRVLQLIDG